MTPTQAIQSPTTVSNLDAARFAMQRRNVWEAIEQFHLAERAGHAPDECAAGRWECWMLLGDFERAWAESDRILELKGSQTESLWDGSSLAGKRVLIRCLHGLGDAIQFIRYARTLRALESRVWVETHPELVDLFNQCPEIERAMTWADGSSKHFFDWDCQIEVMQLPYAFRTTRGTIPGSTPYLNVSAEAVESSYRRLHKEPGKMSIGILWGSSEWNPARSIPLVEFSGLAKLPQVSLYSFQRGCKRDELQTFCSTFQVHDTADGAIDIADTAADMMNMDLIITVDTMAAHLAGALGREVWTLLPFEADWRWMSGNNTPWYPTMTLFRQTTPGDWKPVLERVVQLVVQLH